ncbi:DUF2924 domain-containing protein [Bosea sp. 2YAB26]|uniref:DUF2924 domain-containing protein n=1 Tax=Bosea sp. 2YAB26 TaxID=3237478 RepID=UPI003F8E146D
MAKLARGQETRRRIKTGSVLVREHDGVSHEVVIVPGGFLWNGETHRSLSTLAKRITGTTRNGPRFLGLRQQPAARPRHEPRTRRQAAALRDLHAQIDRA